MENVQILVIRLSHLVCPNLYSFISFAGIPCLLLFYILPSVFLAITLNIPKVLEILPIGKRRTSFWTILINFVLQGDNWSRMGNTWNFSWSTQRSIHYSQPSSSQSSSSLGSTTRLSITILQTPLAAPTREEGN